MKGESGNMSMSAMLSSSSDSKTNDSKNSRSYINSINYINKRTKIVIAQSIMKSSTAATPTVRTPKSKAKRATAMITTMINA